MLTFLDILLTFLHLAIIVFNLSGWIWQKTRKAHLIVTGATAVSWFLMGIWYGWGYCFLTDLQWKVKQKLGETNLPDSFIKYTADNITGMNFNPQTVDKFTLSIFLGVIVITIYVNLFRKKRQSLQTIRRRRRD